MDETCMGLFDEAYKAIEIYKETDYPTYELLKERIVLETFYVRYLLVTLYPYEYNDAALVKEELIAEMRTYGVGTSI